MVDHHGQHLDSRGDTTAKIIFALTDQKAALLVELERLREVSNADRVRLACANAEIERLRALIIDRLACANAEIERLRALIIEWIDANEQNGGRG